MSTEKLRGIGQLSAECQRLVRRLAQVDSIPLQKEVATLLKSDLRTFEHDIQQVKQLAEEEDSLASKESILGKLAEYETQFKQLQISSRQAIWQSKQRVEQQDRKQREELFGMRGKMDEKSFTEQYELKQRHTHGDQRLLQASSEVTEALGKTRKLMEQELEKSSYSAIMLADSSKTLMATRSEYANLGSLMTISKRLISQLESADWFDRVSLLLGVFLFCGVVLYIIKKRTWDVGISWIGWLSGHSTTTKTIKDATVTATTALLSNPTATIAVVSEATPLVASFIASTTTLEVLSEVSPLATLTIAKKATLDIVSEAVPAVASSIASKATLDIVSEAIPAVASSIASKAALEIVSEAAPSVASPITSKPTLEVVSEVIHLVASTIASTAPIRDEL